MASPAVSFARSNQPRFLDELKAFLRIPSISTLDEHKPDVAAAEFVADELRRIGWKMSRSSRPQGHPLVYAEWLHAPASPPCSSTATTTCSRPIRWTSGSRRRSSPTVRNDNIYARGAVDDKGQLYMLVKAVEAF